MVTAARAIAMVTKRVMARVASNEGVDGGSKRVIETMTKRARARVARAMATATRVSGKGWRQQQIGQWGWQWQQ
jgi:hypothetical protein